MLLLLLLLFVKFSGTGIYQSTQNDCIAWGLSPEVLFCVCTRLGLGEVTQPFKPLASAFEVIMMQMVLLHLDENHRFLFCFAFLFLFNLLWSEARSVKACSHSTFPPSTQKLGNSFVRQSTQKVCSCREKGVEKSPFFISQSKASQTNSSIAAEGSELHFFFLKLKTKISLGLCSLLKL